MPVLACRVSRCQHRPSLTAWRGLRRGGTFRTCMKARQFCQQRPAGDTHGSPSGRCYRIRRKGRHAETFVQGTCPGSGRPHGRRPRSQPPVGSRPEQLAADAAEILHEPRTPGRPVHHFGPLLRYVNSAVSALVQNGVLAFVFVGTPGERRFAPISGSLSVTDVLGGVRRSRHTLCVPGTHAGA